MAVKSPEDESAADRESPLTEEHSIIGTLQYITPEQLQGKTADARTDIFALVAVLYEATTGEAAFHADSQYSVMAALDRLVRKCLAKNPEERWQSTTELGDELRRVA